MVLYVAVEGNLGDAFDDVRHALRSFVRSYGAFGSLALLYVEESGVPLPVPGDVYVTYLGHVAAGSASRLLLSWIAIIAVVTAGATNLYLLSRRWGPQLLEHPLASALHLSPHRLERAQGWFTRWGLLAVIFGRHIPGFRIPLTVLAGTLRFPYSRFAPAVAVSTSIWAGAFILLGDRFGRGISSLVGRHPWIYAVGTVVVVLVILSTVFRAARSRSAG